MTQRCAFFDGTCDRLPHSTDQMHHIHNFFLKPILQPCPQHICQSLHCLHSFAPAYLSELLTPYQMPQSLCFAFVDLLCYMHQIKHTGQLFLLCLHYLELRFFIHHRHPMLTSLASKPKEIFFSLQVKMSYLATTFPPPPFPG